MSHRVWLLVEWLDESNNTLPSYGVADIVISKENEVKTGQTLYIQDKKHGSNRKAQVLQISDSKQKVKEYKMFLQRQDNQVQNVLNLCMRTIKEMKQEPMVMSPFNSSKTIFGAGPSNTQKLEANVVDSEDSDDTSSPVRSPGSTRETTSKSTCDATTQTEKTDLIMLRQLDSLKHKLQQLQEQFLLVCQIGHSESHDLSNEDLYAEQNQCEEDMSMTNGNQKLQANQVHQDIPSLSKTLEVRRVSAHTTNNTEAPSCSTNDDMIAIGDGNVSVPKRLINEINWDSYTSATRQLLQAVFPRKILATHSLTGKQSPAFANKPAKMRLDVKIVDDIIKTVSERCGVAKKLVRNAITIKCTDEAKLYRNRQRNRSQIINAHMNQENVSPSSPSSVGS